MTTNLATTGMLATALVLFAATGAAAAQAMEDEPGMDSSEMDGGMDGAALDTAPGMQGQNDTMMHDNDSMMKDDDAMMDDGMDKDGGDDNPLPGLAAVAAVVALGGAAWLARRRA